MSGVNGGNFFGGKGGKEKAMVDEEGGGTERKKSDSPGEVRKRWLRGDGGIRLCMSEISTWSMHIYHGSICYSERFSCGECVGVKV